MHVEANALDVKPGDAHLVECGAWIVSDQSGLRQRLLQLNGFGPVFAIFNDLHSKGKFDQLANQLAASKPKLLWIRLAGPACGSGNRRDDRRASFLVRLLLQQVSCGRLAILEGNVRSEGWNLRPVQEIAQLSLRESLHVWCRYQTIDDDACSAVTRIWSNAELASCAECQCRTDKRHFTAKQFHVSQQQAIESLMLSDVIRQLAQVVSDARDEQPELKTLSSSADAVRINALLSEPDQPNSNRAIHKGNSSSSKTNRPTTSSRAITSNALSSTNTAKTMSNATSPGETLSTTSQSLSTAIRKVSFDPSITHSPPPITPNSVTLIPATANTSDSSRASDQPPMQHAFPTESANRQKERKKAGLEPKKRKQIVEQHQDDVGEDLSSIQVDDAEVSHFLEEAQHNDNLADWEHGVFSFAFGMTNSSNASSCSLTESFDALCEHAEVFLGQCGRHIHVCEMFGGEGTTSTLCTRLFGLTSGKNFEIKCGVDLNTPEDERQLFSYLNKFNPDVVVMAPPCKGFGPWVHLNMIINPLAVCQARADGVPLAKLCARVAEHRLSKGKHFILEQPRTSLMFQMKEWLALEHVLYTANCDQCRFGLRNATGMLLKKPTRFVATDPMLIAHVANRFCHGNHDHGKVTSSAENWPMQLCKKLALGIADLLCGKLYNVSLAYFPTFSCPGCRGHQRKDDPRHTRTGDCKYPNAESSDWQCPGCKSNAHHSSNTHTLGPDCRCAIAATRDEGGGRARKGHHPRDPAVAASRDPTASMRLPAEPNVPVAGEAVEPERLSPEEAARRRALKRSSEVQVGSDPGLVDAAGASGSSAARPLAIANEPSDAPAADGGLAVPNAADAEAIIPVADQPTWSRFDLGTSLQLLRSVRPGVVRRCLRKLHIR